MVDQKPKPKLSDQYCYNKRCDEVEKEKEKKPKMKRNRCGTCSGCKMTDVSCKKNTICDGAISGIGWI